MREMQFTAMVLMTLLTMKLVLLPRWTMSNAAMSKSRWLMTGGTALLAVQFLLQYGLRLRMVDLNKAVMLNLAIFIPCAALFSLAVLSLQRSGRIKPLEKYIGIPVWLAAMALVTFRTSHLHWAQLCAGVLYADMQLFYSFKHVRQLNTTRQTLANYYDREPDVLLRSMQVDIFLLAAMSLIAPMSIFGTGSWVPLFGIFFLMAIFYLVDSFCLYAVGSTPDKVMEAERSEEETLSEEEGEDRAASSEAMQRVEHAVAQWVSTGGHLKSGLKLPSAAEEMQIPRYLLSGWLRQNGRHYSEWLAELRIEEAKRTLREHPEWSNEAVAQHCGFSDRCYFQKVFKDVTGMTPAQYLTT